MSSKSLPAQHQPTSQLQQSRASEGAIQEGQGAPASASGRLPVRLLSPQDLLRLQRAVGNRAVQRLVSAGPPRRPEADLQRFPVQVEARGNAHKFRGGTSMTAKVGAASEWATGSVAPGGVPTLMTRIGAHIQGTNRYIAGHLLNDNMGGQGVNNNLTVLSSDANAAHRGVEAKVKNLAAKADTINNGNKKLGNPAYDHGARYSVAVLPPQPDNTHPFSTQEKYIGSGLRIDIDPIRIHKTTHGESPWPEEDGGTNDLTNHIVPNVPPYPAVPEQKKPSKLIKHIIEAITAHPGGGSASADFIFNYIKTNRNPDIKKASVENALKRGTKLKFLYKRSGMYKVVLKNV